MKIEFIAATKELRKAIREIEVNRGSHSKTDFVDLMVSEVAATLRSVGTEAEIPVNGKHPGSARLPVSLLDRLAKVIRTDKKKEVTILCQSGVVKIGTFSVRHPDIETGIIPDQRVSIPIDLSVLDTWAFPNIVTATDCRPGPARAHRRSATEML